ncbi:MAG: transglycosylase SLT domain-containing protein [Burkholderiaceae bacterium]
MFLLRKIAAGVLAAAASFALVSCAVQAQPNTALSPAATPDDVFLALRDAARRGDALNAFELAARLPDYGIPSYVDYFRLKPRVRELPEAEIRSYLERYQGSAIADRLRNDWLLELGRVHDWKTFDEQYPQFVLDDDLQLKCYALMSKADKGLNVDDDARALLTAPREYGDACVALIDMLAQKGQWKADDVWAQVLLASEVGALPLARRIAVNSGAPDAVVAQALDKPALALVRGPGASASAHQLFILALGRIARNDPAQAAAALIRADAQLKAPEQALGWAQIAFQSSLKLQPEATDYWQRAKGAPLSFDAYQWQVRTALRAGDWKTVKADIEALPETLRDDAAWVYWLGRALKQMGRSEDAELLFRRIAGPLGFYPQLASEELGKPIVAAEPPPPPTAEELAAAAANPGFRRALKFFDMNLRFEGVREWNWELRGMSDRQLLAAAEFARQQNVLDRMVNTSDRTRAVIDMAQRYPTPHRDIMEADTKALGIDMAWVYGLIRQESRFVRNARSHVGASGLMQIMPATARFVARKIGFGGYHPGAIEEVDTNILLGTNYLNMVLGDLDGSQALASAAYNAGPSRPRAWRATLAKPIEGAIFAETIPFGETRGYVKNVLANATSYAAMLEGKPQSLKARLGTVAPKGFVASDLP